MLPLIILAFTKLTIKLTIRILQRSKRKSEKIRCILFHYLSRKSRIICSVSPRYVAHYTHHARLTSKISYRGDFMRIQIRIER